MRIKVLSDLVINQIAAGEVVERPASVVRELVDNAVDSGATDIFVAIESGGHTRIKVRDNGCGMTRDEALLAFERHATSKVATIEDLSNLSTMGFRGEALASIAAVSKVKLTTRAAGASVGTSVTLRGGKVVDVQSVAWNEGSEFEVEHLFFNTPARRKFLRSPRSEVARIRSWLSHSALSRPQIRYRLISDGDEVLNLSVVDSIAARGAQVFSTDLTPVYLSEGGIRIEGMVGHPGQALSDGSGFVILVNGRPVTDKIVMRAAREGYDSMLKDREFPIGYLSISLPADMIDVNVHPQKSEVRVRYPDQIFAVVRGAVLTGVRSMKRPMVATSDVRPQALFEAPRGVQGMQAAEAEQTVQLKQPVMLEQPVQQNMPTQVAQISRFEWPISVSSPMQGAYNAPIAPSVRNPEVVARPYHFRYSELRYIGQLMACYLVCEIDDHLVVVDMHAAHERINYNKIRAARAARSLVTQRLLIPEQVRLTPEQVASLMEERQALNELAFEIEQSSIDAIEIRGVPAIIAHMDCVSVIKEIAAEPVKEGWSERLEERIDHLSARIACHSSIRGGDILNAPQAYALLQQLDQAEIAGACPHGRPVVAQFTRVAVERWFGRDR